MSKVVEIFKDIVKIPRCSYNNEPFIQYIQNQAILNNYICDIDKANNILCKKQNSTAIITLQSHYDIVCLSKNAQPELVQNGDILSAKNSTFGADNGVGCAYMVALMQDNKDAHFLFTADEEVGLIGANELTFDINTPYMLNLDSEEEGGVCIGCAGGVDIFASFTDKKTISNDENLDLYEITISKLQGGHSGVDIDKNIPNAIKLVVETIKNTNAKLLDINGGERINSIPVNLKAIVASKQIPLATHQNMVITKIDTPSSSMTVYSDKIIDFLYEFENGVLCLNSELKVVQTSINVAIIKTTQDEIKIEFSARSMSNSDLKELKDNTLRKLKEFGFSVTTNGKYPAWSPDINEFTSNVLKIYKTYNKSASLEAIHAGLECAIFKDKYPHLKIASIGPTIEFPHSLKERVSIKSIDNVYKVLEDIIN